MSLSDKGQSLSDIVQSLKTIDPSSFENGLNLLLSKYPLRKIDWLDAGTRNFINKLGELTKDCIITVSGTNGGSESVNLLALHPNVLSVGNQYSSGIRHYRSQNNVLTKSYANGVINSTEIYDETGKLQGYDITGNGKVNITPDEVSGGQAFIAQFVGQPMNDMVSQSLSMDEKQLYPLSNGVIKNRLESMLGHPISEESYLELGQYVGFDLIHQKFYFFKEKDGKIIYDPDNSGRPHAVSCLEGCSYAAPKYLGATLEGRLLDSVA